MAPPWLKDSFVEQCLDKTWDLYQQQHPFRSRISPLDVPGEWYVRIALELAVKEGVLVPAGEVPTTKFRPLNYEYGWEFRACPRCKRMLLPRHDVEAALDAAGEIANPVLVRHIDCDEAKNEDSKRGMHR